jgi:hypothetical protein
MYEVLRSAIAEVEHYNRVKVVPPVEGTLDGGAVADIIHLLAELVENATKFAPPHTQVLLRAEPVTAGLAIEIEDRGLGIPRENQRRLNDLLADLERVDVDELLQDGRIGLLVVSALSRRHGVAVRLQTNLYGGTQATIVIPKELIGSEQELEAQARAQTQAQAEPEPVAAVSPGSSAIPVLSPSTPLSGSVESAARTSVLTEHDTATASFGETSTPAWADQSAMASAQQSDQRSDQQQDQKLDQQPTRSSSGGADQRPDLPRRHAQANLAPELLTAPAPPDDDSDTDHNPGLMAAFQKGMRSGQEEGSADGAGSTT